jgi:hypothetical protein
MIWLMTFYSFYALNAHGQKRFFVDEERYFVQWTRYNEFSLIHLSSTLLIVIIYLFIN